MVFVNDGPDVARSPVAPKAPRTSTLQYWSNTEKRWKPVPQSSGLMRRARAAANEVQSAVESRPKSPVLATPLPAVSTSGHRSRGSSSSEIDHIIEEAAARHHVDANLVRAVIKVESNFNPTAVSRKGAMGLMQLMPETARQFNVSNPFDPGQNVEAGVSHLKHLLDNFGGNVGLTLAAYNAGEGAVNRNKGVPPYRETQQYLRQVRSFYDGGEQQSLTYSAPIRVSRDAFGVLTFSNVE